MPGSLQSGVISPVPRLIPGILGVFRVTRDRGWVLAAARRDRLSGGRKDRRMGEFDGRVALVTGAGRLRGIGRATAVVLAAVGADVVVTGTSRDPVTFPKGEQRQG
jgi:phosphoglycerate dehydrogenase-like enzyme